MFRKHRDDLLASMESERAAWKMVITVLADQVEYLRYVSSQTPHMSPALRSLGGPDLPPTLEDDGFKAYLSEEEEELLALRLNEHISEQELENLRGDLAQVIPLPTITPDPGE